MLYSTPILTNSVGIFSPLSSGKSTHSKPRLDKTWHQQNRRGKWVGVRWHMPCGTCCRFYVRITLLPTIILSGWYNLSQLTFIDLGSPLLLMHHNILHIDSYLWNHYINLSHFIFNKKPWIPTFLTSGVLLQWSGLAVTDMVFCAAGIIQCQRTAMCNKLGTSSSSQMGNPCALTETPNLIAELNLFESLKLSFLSPYLFKSAKWYFTYWQRENIGEL